MSFGPSNTAKTAQNNLSGISSTATNQQLPMLNAAGTSATGAGTSDVTSGTNFFNTLLNGNSANTGATLAPSIQQIQGGNANTLNALTTLMPRGGGRSGTLFNQSFAPTSQIGNLFNGARTTAATTLPQIGLQQQQIGANLFGLGNQALGTATGASSALGGQALQSQQMSNQLAAGLGSGLFNLATTPVGGGASVNGLLGLI